MRKKKDLPPNELLTAAMNNVSKSLNALVSAVRQSGLTDETQMEKLIHYLHGRVDATQNEITRIVLKGLAVPDEFSFDLEVKKSTRQKVEEFLRYPPDGGLREPVRPIEQTQSVGEVLADEIARAARPTEQPTFTLEPSPEEKRVEELKQQAYKAQGGDDEAGFVDEDEEIPATACPIVSPYEKINPYTKKPRVPVGREAATGRILYEDKQDPVPVARKAAPEDPNHLVKTDGDFIEE